jgi:hypothetical protein
VRRNANFPGAFNANMHVQMSAQKYSCFYFSEIDVYDAHPASCEMGVRVVTIRQGGDGRIDAVRAVCARMDGRGADGEVVWSRVLLWLSFSISDTVEVCNQSTEKGNELHGFLIGETGQRVTIALEQSRAGVG